MHKFKVGQAVDYAPSRMTQAARGTYSIIHLMPEEKDCFMDGNAAASCCPTLQFSEG